MRKLLSAILLLCSIITLIPATTLAADKNFTLFEDWRLTGDFDLGVSSGDVLIIDGANKYYIYEMGGVLKNTGTGTVYLKNTQVYAAGDNPSDNSLAALSQAAKSVTVASPAKDATVLTLPVIAGYNVTVKNSSNTGIISPSGSIAPPSSAANVTLVLTLTDTAGNKADTGSISITVPARTQSSAPTPTPTATATSTPTPTSAPSGSNGSSTPQQSIPAAGDVKVSYTESNGIVTLSLPDGKVTEIIDNSDNLPIFDLSGLSGATTAVLPKSALNTLGKAGLDTSILLPQGTITLDAAALQSISTAAQGNDVSVAVRSVVAASLNATQQAALESGDIVIDISVLSGSQNISTFDGTLTAAMPYSGPLPVGVWYLSDAGTLEKLTYRFDEASKTVSFDLPGHLSLYLIGKDSDIPAWVSPFTDITENDWFYADVEFAVKNSLFNGTSTTAFGPDMPMTRGMLATVLGRLHDADVSGFTASSFTDVSAGQYYAPYVEWAKESGIVNGIGNNSFSPDSMITRQDLAAIIMRYAEYANKQIIVTQQYVIFTDEDDISDYAKNAIQTLYKAGVISGVGNSSIDPKGNATRAQVAAILHRLVEKIQ